MVDAHTITETMKLAGERFASDFAMAGLDPRHAPDLSRVPGEAWRDGGAVHVASARLRVHGVLKALGGSAGGLSPHGAMVEAA